MSKKSKKASSLFKKLLDKAIDAVKDIKSNSSVDNTEYEPEPLPPAVIAPEVMKVEVSSMSVAKATATVLLVLAFAYFLIEISSILLLFFVAFLFTAGLDQTVTKLQQRLRFPRALTLLLVYVIIFSVFTLTLTNLAPLVADQISALAAKIFEFFDKVAAGESDLPFSDALAPYFQSFTEGVDLTAYSAEVRSNLQNLSKQLLSFGENIWSAIVVISNGLFNTFIVLVLTFFMVVEWKQIEEAFVSLFPNRHTAYVVSHIDAVKSKIGYWLRGQLMLSVAIAILSYIALLIIGLDYAVTLALIAGLTEVVPVVGPLIAWLVALPVAANVSAWTVLWITIAYFVIQQVESNILVPLIMKKAVGLSPLAVIFAMMIGYSYLGILGVILSIPIAASLAIFAKDYARVLKDG